jgi:hypothetical protein
LALNKETNGDGGGKSDAVAGGRKGSVGDSSRLYRDAQGQLTAVSSSLKLRVRRE